MGKFLFIGAIMLLVAGIANFFIQSSALMITLSVLAIGIFSAFILYDLKRVQDGDETNYISATLGVYLSIYNVFQSLLALLGISGGATATEPARLLVRRGLRAPFSLAPHARGDWPARGRPPHAPSWRSIRKSRVAAAVRHVDMARPRPVRSAQSTAAGELVRRAALPRARLGDLVPGSMGMFSAVMHRQQARPHLVAPAEARQHAEVGAIAAPPARRILASAVPKFSARIAPARCAALQRQARPRGPRLGHARPDRARAPLAVPARSPVQLAQQAAGPRDAVVVDARPG